MIPIVQPSPPTARNVAIWIEIGELSVLHQSLQASVEGADLPAVEQPPQLRVQRLGAGGVREERGHLGHDVAGDWLAAKIPDHRPQLGLHVERQAVIDPPQLAAAVPQAVAGLAIGVVGEDVEEKETHQVGFVRLAQGILIRVRLRVDVPLDRSNTVRAVADDRRRDEIPADRLGDQERRVLPTVEGPVWEVPERNLATPWLVDRQSLLLAPAQDDREAVIGP